MNLLVASAIKFLNSNKLGIQYENDIFVGDIDKGNLYHFDLNEDRTELVLKEPLVDKLADSDDENEGIIFGQGFGAITDIEVGPDGYIYIVGFQGTIYRIVPIQELSTDNFGLTAAGNALSLVFLSTLIDNLFLFCYL